MHTSVLIIWLEGALWVESELEYTSSRRVPHLDYLEKCLHRLRIEVASRITRDDRQARLR